MNLIENCPDLSKYDGQEQEQIKILKEYLDSYIGKVITYDEFREFDSFLDGRSSNIFVIISAYNRNYGTRPEYSTEVLHLTNKNCDLMNKDNFCHCYYIDHNSQLQYRKHKYKNCPYRQTSHPLY